MKKIVLTINMLIILGCAQQPSEPKKIDRNASTGRMSTVIVAAPDLAVAANSSFAWLPNTSLLENDARLDSQTIQVIVKEAIQASLSAKGYQFIPTGEQSDYLVAFVVALEGSASDKVLTIKYGVTPGLKIYSDNIGVDKGTIIVEIVQAGSNHSLWRGALQGLVQLELDDVTRRKRINSVVSDLLSKFP